MKEFLDLGTQPLANNYRDINDKSEEYLYNLKIGFNQYNYLVSIIEQPSGQLAFNDSYPYMSSSSQTMIGHFKQSALEIKKRNPKNILEIGSNDGIFLRNFGPNIITAVEPCNNFACYTNTLGYKTYAKFWNNETANELISKHGLFDFIFAANSIPHINNIEEAFSAVSIALSNNGYFIIECPYLLDILQNNAFDQWYNEHPHTLSVLSIGLMAYKYNMFVSEIQKINVHGGSIRVFIRKRGFHHNQINTVKFLDNEISNNLDVINGYTKISNFAQQTKKELKELLLDLKTQNKKIIAYGATAKSATVFNYCDIGPDIIDCIVDTTPNKQNKLSPGKHIPIVRPREDMYGADYVLLTAWNYKSEILNKEKPYINNGGRFISYIPQVEIL